MGSVFGDNVGLLLAEREMTFAELVRQMFVGEYHYPSEFWRLYRKLYHYKKEHFLPQERWVDRMVVVLGVDYAEFFRRD